uniref:Uncharacterized protein n=1 Tax=Romanomermis culicivorax TaxID=13658 RepID=A0A915HJS0_ROMCU
MLFAIICCSISVVQTQSYSNIISVVCSEIVMIIVVSTFIAENDRNYHIVDHHFEMGSNYIMFVIHGYLGFQTTLERSTTLELYTALLFYALMTVFYADARRLQINRVQKLIRAQKHD